MSPNVSFGVHLNGLVEHFVDNAGGVVVALDELVPPGDRFLFLLVDHLFDEGESLSRIVEEPPAAVFRLAFFRVRFLVEVLVSRKHDLFVREERLQRVGACADRTVVEFQVSRDEGPLFVEAIRFTGQGCKEGHGQPVDELRVFPLQGPFLLPPLGPDPGEFALKPLCQLVEAEDVLCHRAEQRAFEFRVSEPLDLVDVICGGQLTGPGLWEVVDLLDPPESVFRQVIVNVPAIRIRCEARMVLIENPLPDADGVNRLPDLVGRGIPFECVSMLVIVHRCRHFFRREGGQLVGALQVVVLQGGFVNLQDEVVLVRGIRNRRVKMLGRLAKRGVQIVLALFRRAVRVVRAACERDQCKRNSDETSAC